MIHWLWNCNDVKTLIAELYGYMSEEKEVTWLTKQDVPESATWPTGTPFFQAIWPRIEKMAKPAKKLVPQFPMVMIIVSLRDDQLFWDFKVMFQEKKLSVFPQ